HESLGLPEYMGVAVMAFFTLLVVLQALTGILRINSVIVPMLFTVIISVLASGIIRDGTGDFASRLAGNYEGGFAKPLVFFIFYCCYNTFLSLGVLTAIPERTQKRPVLIAGVFLGAMGLMLLSLMLDISLTLKSPRVFDYSIPMGYIAADLGSIVKSAVSLCIWCEIFSTAVSNAFSLARRLSASGRLGYKSACFVTVIGCLPIALADFKGLIGFFYPIFGALSMFLILKLIYTSFILGKKRKKAAALIMMLVIAVSMAFWGVNEGRSTISIQAPAPSYNASMKQDLLCLMIAYPGYITGVEKSGERVYIVMKSGKKLLYDDKKAKSQEGRLAYPDLQDMLEQPYPITYAKELMKEGQDPGRARVYGLLDEVYGSSREEIERNLITVSAGGARLRFNKSNGAAEALSKAMKELSALAAGRRDIAATIYPCNGTYNYRLIAGTNRLSSHSYGTAVDLAYNKRDYWRWTSREEGQKRLESYPAEIVEVFERNNFIWGGKWSHFDIMHFEYRPELLLKARYFGDTGGSYRSWYRGVPLEDEYVRNCIIMIDKVL
ncbi:MAG: M15 family metallopeptidase, partial [Pseudomonadota bacterium]